jgi:predicted DNA-binding transcriptional regulator AlpA
MNQVPETYPFRSADRVVLLAEASMLTGLSMKTLKRLSCDEDGPRLFKLSPRRIAIRHSDLTQWIDTRVANRRS